MGDGLWGFSLCFLRNGDKKAFVAEGQGPLSGKTLIFKKIKNSDHLQGEEVSIHVLKLLSLEEMKTAELKSNRNLGEDDSEGEYLITLWCESENGITDRPFVHKMVGSGHLGSYLC